MEENARFLWSGYFSLKNKEDIMITWNNLDTLDSYKELSKASRVNLAEVMSGENGAERVKNYSIPMAEGFSYNYAAKAVDDDVLDALVKLAKEAQLAEKFKALYNGEVVNTGEKRLVLHHMTRGQLGEAVEADGVDKRTFYTEQQAKIADFANKYMQERSQTEPVRNLQRLYRSVSAEVTWDRVHYISHLRTGQRQTTPSRWKQNSSATLTRMMQLLFLHL